MNPHLAAWAIEPDQFPADGFASDRLEFLLHYAILAPSPHNTQPWLFRVNVSDVELFADRRRQLPVTDPLGRELTLSCGAALFNLRVAAEYFAQAYTYEVLPDPRTPQLLARLTLGGTAETSADDIVMFGALIERRTNREPFDPEPVPIEVLDLIAAAAAREGAWVEVIADDDRRAAAAALVAQADRVQWANRDFRSELARWIRTDAERQADGIPTREMGVSDWMAFAGPALVRTFNRGNNQAARDADIATHSPALVVLGTDTDDPAAWVNAGQALESVLLHLQAEGIAASYLNQPVEITETRRELTDLIGRAGYPQALMRIGRGQSVPPTPRRSLRGVLLAQDHSKDPPH
ncbi:MAG: nitroreductase family protein [Verrucomicrobiales bacterium]|nr:nitroreductase family protein [Verrucomicrobiales bacterium]